METFQSTKANKSLSLQSEQENRHMKVLDEIKGIINNQSALDQLFLIAFEMIE